MVHLSKNMDAFGLYVALTRHRNEAILYHNKEELSSFSAYANSIRVGYKDLVHDYSIKKENEEYYFNVEDYKTLGIEIALGIKNGEKVDKLMHERKEIARAILSEKEEHKHYIMQAGLTIEGLEIKAGIKEKPLSFIEEKAKTTVELYATTSQKTRDLWREIRKNSHENNIKNHPSYALFEQLKDERGSLASVIIEAPILHKTFIKDVSKELGYGFSVIKKQAENFQTKQLLETQKNTIQTYEKAKNVDVLTSYLDAKNQFNDIWKDLKPQLKELDGTLLKPTLNDQVDKLQSVALLRDKAAYKMITSLEDYQSLATQLKVSLDVVKLFEQAENGQRKTCIEQYLYSDSIFAKSMAAHALNELVTLEKSLKIKATTREFYQHKIDFKQVKKEAEFFEKVVLSAPLKNEKTSKIGHVFLNQNNRNF
ncbi:MAG TPA: hypothetical protein VI959_01455, partial [Alphaproteobacteria bacterium]|nr:hypothetical protein [Alphaproteobacteria bacterium]